MAEVVVIGAGVGGLACAARLAAGGHRVTVFEQSTVVGGKLGRLDRETAVGTFRFDTGPSLLTLPQVIDELFESIGGAAPRAVPVDPIVRHVFADGTVLDSCADPLGFAERIGAALGWAAADDWLGLWRRAGRVWDASWRDVLRRPVDSPRDLAPLAWRLGDLAAVAPGQTLRGVGRRHLRDPRLRMLLDRYATYAGADPRRAPAALVAVPYAELAFGGWYLPGGLRTLADALAARCADLGVTIHTGTAVTGIATAGNRVRGVILGPAGQASEPPAESRAEGPAGVPAPAGVEVPADVVVSNVDALTVYRDLLPTPRRLGRLAGRSLAGFVLLLGVRGRTPGQAHHTVYFPHDYDAEFDAVFGRHGPARPAADPTVFVTVADDPLVRPAGHEAWFVLVNAPRHGTAGDAVDWGRAGLAEAYADRVLDVLATRGPDVRDRLLFREILTPAWLKATTGAPGGAIYGTAGGLLRPPNRGPVGGLYLVGGSTHPGGGLPMVALSARIVAEQIGPA